MTRILKEVYRKTCSRLKIAITKRIDGIIYLAKLALPVLIIFSGMSCVNDDLIEVIEDVDPPIETIQYLALGDSYTIGQSVVQNLRWPNQLADSLSALEYKIDSTTIIAKTGWTTRDLIDAIDNTELGSYNLVSLLIGVNNQYQNQPFAIFESEFDVLLEKSIQLANSSSRVFVVSIPDYGVTPFGSQNSEKISQEIDKYNAYIAAKCEEYNIPFINITEISRSLADSQGALAPDQLHPSGSQYTEWMKEILPVVRVLLD